MKDINDIGGWEFPGGPTTELSPVPGNNINATDGIGGKSKKRKVKKYKRTKKVLHKKSLRGGGSCNNGGRRRRKRKSIKKSRH